MGEPGLPLIQLVRPPVALLDQPHLRINGLYYITKVIGPPLNRCLLLIGADCLAWLAELPRTNVPALPHNSRLPGQVISQYFISRRCAACSSPSMKPLCQRCSSSPARAATLLAARVARLQLDREVAEGACVKCCGPQGSSCISLDCPSLYRRRGQEKRVGQLVLLRSLMDGLQLWHFTQRFLTECDNECWDTRKWEGSLMNFNCDISHNITSAFQQHSEKNHGWTSTLTSTFHTTLSQHFNNTVKKNSDGLQLWYFTQHFLTNCDYEWLTQEASWREFNCDHWPLLHFIRYILTWLWEKVKLWRPISCNHKVMFGLGVMKT